MSQSTKVLKEFGAVTSFGGSIDKVSGTTLGALNLGTAITVVTTTGAATASLADGFEGQVKTIVMAVDGGALTLTPTNLGGTPTTITFDDVGDSVSLVFAGGAWWSVGTATATIA